MERMKLAAKMLSQVLPERHLESLDGSIETVFNPAEESLLNPQEQEIASNAIKKVIYQESVDEAEQDALEAIVLPYYRPVIDIQNNSFSNVPQSWKHLEEPEYKARIEQVIPSIGRIDVPEHPQMPYAGTGFVVGDNLLMTNRHVAEIFATGQGTLRLDFKPGQTASIDFMKEFGSEDTYILAIEKVMMIYPCWDMALLKVSGLPNKPSPLRLSTQHPEDMQDDDIVVIGYPAQDFRSDLYLQNRIFHGIYNVKRLQPGKLKELRTIESFGKEVKSVTHDSSTLGGNSGSAVINIATGEVVALHFAGRYLDANFAIPTYELACDAKVVDAGLNFTSHLALNSQYDLCWQSINQEQMEGNDLTSSSATKQAQATTTQSISQPILNQAIEPSGNVSVTWTIPLQVTVNLGQPIITNSSQISVSHQEGFFKEDSRVTSDIYIPVNPILAALQYSKFDWKTAFAMAKASEAVYKNQAQIEHILSNNWGLEQAEFIEEKNTQCFIAATSSVVIIAFRGTANFYNWLSNLDTLSIDSQYGRVHRGFMKAFEVVEPQLTAKLLLPTFAGKPILLTGHSLGGALASIAAAHWKQHITGVYTFGQPRVGKKNFQQYINENTFYRFVNNDDIVPRVPPGYSHIGQLFHFNATGNLKVQHELLETYDTEALSEAAFAQLQERLKSNPAIVTEAMTTNLEGFMPSISDHDMKKYIDKIKKQIL